MADFDSALPVRQSDATAFNATVVGAGTAGTPDPGVVTIQGASGMYPVKVQSESDNPDGIPFGYLPVKDGGSAAAVAAGAAAGAALATLAFTQAGYLRKVAVAASGKGKFEVLVGANFGAAVAADLLPIFTTAAKPTGELDLTDQPFPVAAGDSIFIKATNQDNQSQDLYAYANGIEEAP